MSIACWIVWRNRGCGPNRPKCSAREECSEGSRAETKYELLVVVRPKWQWRNKGGRKSGGVRKANNYYMPTEGGTDGRTRRMEEERFGGKYSEQQAREAASERGRSAHRLTY